MILCNMYPPHVMKTLKKETMKKGPWSRDEDEKLLAYIQQHGHGSWSTLPQNAGLERCGKSCRLRWTNYLRPDIKRGKFDIHEEKSIIRLHALLGNRWSLIAAHLPKRTDNEIKNYWNTRLKKRLTRMGIDPATHKPKSGSPQSTALSHMAQWETARLEAEARLARECKLRRAAVSSPPCLDVLKVWRSLEFSPTSTLNFSGAVPAVEGKTENLHGDGGIYGRGYDCVMMGAVDQGAFNHGDSDMIGHVSGENEDNVDYWSDMLDYVSSTMEL